MGRNRVSLWLAWACLAHCAGMLSHVERYEVVRPQRLAGRHKRSLRDTQVYPDTVRYELVVEGRNLTIYLEKNRNLLGSSYTETHYSEDGKRVTTPPDEEEHCYYHGHVEGMKDSSVSVGVCSGISGFVRAQQQVYLIEPLGRSDDGDHAVYRRERLKVSGQPSCGSSSNASTPYDRDWAPPLTGLLRSRSWKSKPDAGPQRFVELYVVVDNAEYKKYGSKTKPRVLEVINHVDKLYRPLNIRVMLVGLEMWTNKDHIVVQTNPETTLDNFLRWRQTDLLNRHKHDTAQLVTGKDFDEDTVGLANKFAMCSENSAGVNQDHHDNPIGLASTIAHEMGHNFGLSHDTARCVCGPSYSSGNCVMADKLRTGNEAFPEFFSDCSFNQLDEFMKRAQPSCLSKPPSSVKTMSVAPRCGNALLDTGEECDCGTVEECSNPCCDASTCQLTAGSRCAHGQCCENCQLKAAGSVCRPSASDCDLPEYCTGMSKDCPEDSFEMNGTPCDNQAEGYCYDGQCPTLLQHCWRLFGPGTTLGSDVCFNLNTQGLTGSNCGRTRGRPAPCARENVKCGSIFCGGGGGESITGSRALLTVMGVECHIPVDNDKTRSLDMVPNGTRCGPNKVCLHYRCVDVSVYGTKEECAKKCNGHGVCNHKEACHCDPGWAPPYCHTRYADSPQGQGGVIAGVCAALSTLLVVVVIIVVLLRCKKNNVENYTCKRKVHSAPDKLNPMFQEPGVKDRPQISEPTFMESTASQASTPLLVAPSRAAPQIKPQPPSKPLPPLNKTQNKAVKPAPPPVPAAKPSPPPAARIKPDAPPVKPSLPPVPRIKPVPPLLPQ